MADGLKRAVAAADTPGTMASSAPPPDAARDAAFRMADDGRFADGAQWLRLALASAEGSDQRQELVAAIAELARRAEAAGELDVAQRALESALEQADWADLHCRHGCLLVRRGRLAAARESFDRALVLNPRYRGAAVERALLDARDGRLAEAMATLRGLANDGAMLEPSAFHQGLEQLGHAEFEQGEALLRRSLSAGDEWLEERLRRYQELLRASNATGALALLREASLERPGYPDLQMLIGAHELQSGAFDDAVESFTRALELNPGYHAARVELARAFEARGDTPGALHQLELVLEADASHGEARQLHERWTSRHRGQRAQSGRGSKVS